MDNLMGPYEAAAAVTSGAGGFPRFLLSGDEARLILDACTKAGISGPLMAKVETMFFYSQAKTRFSARTAVVEMK